MCFGKVIGGCVPVGAIAGLRSLMELFAPLGPVYQAGTLSGNPLAMAAGLAALRLLDEMAYETLEDYGCKIEKGLSGILGRRGHVLRVGSMISIFLSERAPTSFSEAKTCDREGYADLFHRMLEQGIYLPPSPLESWFFTVAHSTEDLDRTLEAFQKAVRA